MAEDITYTDDAVEQKNHPRAKDCLIISLVPVVLIGCGIILSLLDNIYPEHHYDFLGYIKMTLALFLISLLMQPLGIILGIFSLVQIRKESTYCGNYYAITGIIISFFTVIVGLCILV